MSTKNFLRLVHGGDGLVEIRMKNHGEGGEVRQKFTTLEAAPSVTGKSGWHTWFGVAPRVRRGGKRDDCSPPPCFFVDIDPEGDKLAPNYFGVVERSLPLPPSVVVHSGRGFQLYWLTPALTDGAEWESVQRGFTATVREALASLPVKVDATIDLPRVMRLPGTINPKNDEPCVVLASKHNLRYDLTDFPLTATTTKVQEISGAVVEGSRNQDIFAMVSALKWRGGLRGEALRVSAHALNEAMCVIPLPKQEVDTIVDHLVNPSAPAPAFGPDVRERLQGIAEVAAFGAEQLSDRIMVVDSGGRPLWYAWHEERGIWLKGSAVGPLFEWLKDIRAMAFEAGDDALVTVLQRCLIPSNLQSMLVFLSGVTTLPTYFIGEQINTCDMILPLRNGYLNLDTHELQAPDPEMRFSKRADMSFRPNATCPRWRAFIEQMIPDAQEREFLGRCFYYCLTGSNEGRAFFINLGGGRNGKTLAWSTLQAMLGDFASPGDDRVVTTRADSSHDAPVLMLRHLRLALYDELRSRESLNGSQIKRITGSPFVSARGAYSSEHDKVRMTAKQVLISNSRPKIDGEDQAVADRLRYVSWRVRVREEDVDPALPEKLLAERDGILNWVLEHKPGWDMDKTLPMPPALAEEARLYLEEENEVLAFVRLYIKVPESGYNSGFVIKGKELRDKWADYTGTKASGGAMSALYRDVVNMIHATYEGTDEVRVDRTRREVRIVGVKIGDPEEKMIGQQE